MRLRQYFNSRLPILSLSLVLAATTFCQAQLPEPNESQIRAMMIINLTKFIDWPSSRSDVRSPFTICVVGNDPIGVYLENLLNDKKIQGRSARVFRDTAASQAEQCHILYWAYPDRSMKTKLSAALTNGSVLTVSEEHQTQSGTIIGLPLIDGHVAIEIDNGMARRGNLVLSSHLLQLATEVHK